MGTQRRWAVAVVSIALTYAGLAGCTPGDASARQVSPDVSTLSSRPAAPSSAQSHAPSEWPSMPPSQPALSETPIRIIVGETTFDAVLWDNPAARSLLDQIPLTLEFTDYGGREVIAEPPQPIAMDDMPEGDSPVTGDLGYYAPSGVVSLHYSDIGYWDGSASARPHRWRSVPAHGPQRTIHRDHRTSRLTTPHE